MTGVRLIAVCGVGSPSRPLADRTVAAARAEGLRAVLVRLDDPGVDVAGESPRTPWGTLTGSALAALGADAVPGVVLAGSGAARRAVVLAQIVATLADPQTDVVVLDSGDVGAARELVAHPAEVAAGLDAVLGPRLAMRSDDTADGLFARLSAAREDTGRAGEAITGPDACWRVVLPARATAMVPALRAVAGLVVLGARVDGIVLDGYPRKAESADRAAAAAMRTTLADGLGVAVWRGGEGRRVVPKGAPARGPAGPVARLVAREPLGDDSQWQWALSMPAAVARVARVGVAGDRLVVEADGALGWLDLPPVLRRTVAVDARRERGGLLVRFRPDPAAWPKPVDGTDADLDEPGAA